MSMHKWIKSLHCRQWFYCTQYTPCGPEKQQVCDTVASDNTDCLWFLTCYNFLRCFVCSTAVILTRNTIPSPPKEQYFIYIFIKLFFFFSTQDHFFIYQVNSYSSISVPAISQLSFYKHIQLLNIRQNSARNCPTGVSQNVLSVWQQTIFNYFLNTGF